MRQNEDNAFGWQIDRPVFVKIPFSAFGRKWERGQNFNWLDQPFRAEDWMKQLNNVHQLYLSGHVHHDTQKEVANKVGDRLSEMNRKRLDSLVRLVNAEVKKNTGSKAEFDKKKCKFSSIDSKQRGLIRQWLRANPWASEMFYTFRDQVLEENHTEAT